MRYFISVDVKDEGVKEALVNLMNRIEGYGDTKTVRPENLHLTLLFLGERLEEELEEIKSRFIDSCEAVNVGEFTCNVEDVGVFPHMNYIKTVWVGVKPREPFDSLHMKFSEYMNGVNEHDFIPHITVGRVRGIDPGDKKQLKAEIERHSGGFGAFQVKNVRLKQSELREDGPEYRDMEVYRL